MVPVFTWRSLFLSTYPTVTLSCIDLPNFIIGKNILPTDTLKKQAHFSEKALRVTLPFYGIPDGLFSLLISLCRSLFAVYIPPIDSTGLAKENNVGLAAEFE